MSNELIPTEKRDAGRFHPLVFKVLAGLAVWFVLSAWAFAGHGRTDYLLSVVSAFVLVAVGLPSLLGTMRRKKILCREGAGREGRFGNWASFDVQILTGPVKGIVAAIETILPIAAVAFGMTFFGLALHFAVR